MSRFGIWLTVALVGTLLGIAQFIGCTAYAISKFPDSYSFTDNYLSQLGRSTLDYSDLYNGSLAILGVSLIPLFITLMLVDRRRDSISMKVAAGLGILSSLGLLGMATMPIDVHLILHHLAQALWLFPMVYMTVVFFYSASRHPYVGIGFIIAGLIMAVTMIAVLLSLDMPGYMVFQNVVIGCGLVWLSFMVWFVFQMGLAILKTETADVDTRKEQESDYFANLYRQQSKGITRRQ